MKKFTDKKKLISAGVKLLLKETFNAPAWVVVIFEIMVKIIFYGVLLPYMKKGEARKVYHEHKEELKQRIKEARDEENIINAHRKLLGLK